MKDRRKKGGGGGGLTAMTEFCSCTFFSWSCMTLCEENPSDCITPVVFEACHSGSHPWENPGTTSVGCNTMKPLIYELIASYLLIGTNYPANWKLMETWWGMIVLSSPSSKRTVCDCMSWRLTIFCAIQYIIQYTFCCYYWLIFYSLVYFQISNCLCVVHFVYFSVRKCIVFICCACVLLFLFHSGIVQNLFHCGIVRNVLIPLYV